MPRQTCGESTGQLNFEAPLSGEGLRRNLAITPGRNPVVEFDFFMDCNGGPCTLELWTSGGNLLQTWNADTACTRLSLPLPAGTTELRWVANGNWVAGARAMVDQVFVIEDSGLTWTDPAWVDQDSTSGPGGGEIRVADAATELADCLIGDVLVMDFALSNNHITREVDLSGFGYGQFRIEWEREGLSNFSGEGVDVFISPDGGASWTYLFRLNSSDGSGCQTDSAEIPPAFMTSNFRVRLQGDDDNDSGDKLFVKRIEIRGSPLAQVTLVATDNFQCPGGTPSDPASYQCEAGGGIPGKWTTQWEDEENASARGGKNRVQQFGEGTDPDDCPSSYDNYLNFDDPNDGDDTVDYVRRTVDLGGYHNCWVSYRYDEFANDGKRLRLRFNGNGQGFYTLANHWGDDGAGCFHRSYRLDDGRLGTDSTFLFYAEGDWGGSDEMFFDEFEIHCEGYRNGTEQGIERPIQITGLSNPAIAFDYLIDEFRGADEGVALEYSTDGGTSWNLLQLFGEPYMNNYQNGVCQSGAWPIPSSTNRVRLVGIDTGVDTNDVLHVDNFRITDAGAANAYQQGFPVAPPSPGWDHGSVVGWDDTENASRRRASSRSTTTPARRTTAGPGTTSRLPTCMTTATSSATST